MNGHSSPKVVLSLVFVYALSDLTALFAARQFRFPTTKGIDFKLSKNKYRKRDFGILAVPQISSRSVFDFSENFGKALRSRSERSAQSD
jgi:hypothetical protein